jgi:hypothetical protein
MSKWVFAFLAAALLSAGGYAQGAKNDPAATIQNQMINVPSAGSWNVWGAQGSQRKDDTVTGGYAMRVVATKGVNSWDAAASVAIIRPIKKGDVILAAFWARAEKPAPGKTTATTPSASLSLIKPPYTGLFSEPAEIGPAWAMYYASGVADRDYDAGELNFSVQLAAANQVIDFGPAFVVDLGPDYARSKLPHNKLASAAPPPAAAAAAAPAVPVPVETRFAADLAKLRVNLPAKGKLISDPEASINTFGPDQTSQPVSAPGVTGGNAVRVTFSRRGADPWSDGAGLPLKGDIHKGDAVLVAVYLKAADNGGAGQACPIPSLGLQMASSPWSAIATSAVEVTDTAWKLFYASGVAAADYPAGAASLMLQIGSCNRTLDIGPAFVLDLGPGVELSKLPKN